VERELQFSDILQPDPAAENDMKIYLLIVLMGALWTAIRVTSTQKRENEPLSQ